MLAAKFVIVEAALGVLTITAASGVNGLAETIVLFTGALAGVLWLWANILRPVAKIVRRTANAAAHLEELPAWRETTDARLGDLENSMQAMLRDLDIPRRDS